MKMQYDGQEYDVKLKRMNNKLRRAMTKLKEELGPDEEEIDLLPLMVESVDGVPIEKVDDELQWAAEFTAMSIFTRLSEKKSAAKGAGRR